MKRLLILVSLLAMPAAGITLVHHGRSNYTIVLAAQASPSEQRAAKELQRFIEEISGARLPVVTDVQPAHGDLVLVGDSAVLKKLKIQAPSDPESFVIETAGKTLVIAGGRQRGTMYGVYTFLDKLGCRWFTRDVSRIPKQSTIEIASLSEIHKPAFEYREPFFTEAWDKDWAARNRTNGDHTQLDDSTGGKLQYYPFVHSFYELLPPTKYFADHPEYYSLIDGKRRAERGQLCLTNPEVLRLAITQVETWIKQHPEATLFSVSQNDWEGWCECDRCRRVEQEEGGQHSGPLLRFVNAVAEEIGKRHPGKLIDTLAYWYTENPPLKVRPVANVRIRLCPIGICEAHSFTQCPRSAYFYKNLEAWSKITNQLYIWHYNTNFSHYLLPFPDFDELAADIPVYQKHGVVGLFMQGAYAHGGGGENSELRAYVLAQLLWDPSINVDRTVDEFFSGVYGPAAPAMREYFNLLQREVRPPAGRHLWIFAVPDYSADFLLRAKEAFARALTRAPDDATRRRVLKARLPVEYYEFLRESTSEVHGDTYGPRDLDSLIVYGKDLFSRMRSFGIESIHERQTLNRDETGLAEMKNLPAIALENAAWRVDVVPKLNGRVVRMIDKATGRDAGGQLISAHNDYYAKAWDIGWIPETQSTATSLVMTGNCDNGVRLQRSLELTASGLHTVTTAENTGKSPVATALQARAELVIGNIDAAGMRFTRISGERIEKSFIVEGQPPAGKETWTGNDRPAGQWQLLRADGGAFFTRFVDAQVARSYLNWTAKSQPGVTFGIWSAERILAPGETLRLEADYSALAQVRNDRR